MNVFLLVVVVLVNILLFLEAKPGENLRGETAVVEIKDIDGDINNGYYESVFYTGGNFAKGCVDPIMKVNYAINVCAPSSFLPGFHVKSWPYADAYDNTYYVYNQYFTDNDCKVPVYERKLIFQRPILVCSQPVSSGFELDHVISQPRNPTTDNLGISILIYDTRSNCKTNNYKEGLLESFYTKKNYCIQDKAGDYKYSSCTPNALTMVRYTSTDGTCKGKAVSTDLNNNNACTDGTQSLGNSYQGWKTWGCAANPV